jgi:hypothetical protein
VQGAECKGQGAECRVQGAECRVQGDKKGKECGEIKDGLFWNKSLLILLLITKIFIVLLKI